MSAHIAQLAVGLLPSSVHSYLSASEWLVPTILKDFSMGLASRLAEVLRRREALLDAARLSASEPSGSSVAPSANARHVTVVDLRALEQHAPAVAPTVRPRAPAPSQQFVAQRSEAAISLPEWIKQHRCLKACAVESGEPSVALLLLLEADHGKVFPSRAVDVTGRLSTFTKRLRDAAAVDPELQRWLSWKLMPFSLVPGLPCRVHVRWALRIESSVGEPFLATWKAHVLDQVRQNQEASRCAHQGSRLPREPATSSRGWKRKQVGARSVGPSSFT